MTSHGFNIVVTSDSLEVSRDPRTSPKDRFKGAAFLFGLTVLLFGGLSVLPGKPGTHSIWADLLAKPADYSKLWSLFCFIFPFTVLMAWYMIYWILAAWPADDALYCDRSECKISRTRWFDTEDVLVSRTYPITEITQIRYAVFVVGKGRSIYGLKFRVNGKKQKLLAGLEAPEAKLILGALQHLGADVLDDPTLEQKVKVASEWRGGNTSWMDRSWMDRDSNSSDHKD